MISSASSSVSLISLVREADIVVQMVMGILVLASLWSWSIIFDKFLKFQMLKNRSDKFEEVFDSMLLEDINLAAKENDNHPLARIFLVSIEEWKSNDIKSIVNDGERKNSLKERLSSVMQIATNQSMQKLEEGLNFLAITGSSAPFIGLFDAPFH